jgi:putative SOS response-associated peptidase YedK
VMLSKPGAIEWMAQDQDGAVLADLMSPRLTLDLSVVPVSTFVSNSRNNGPRCIEPDGDPIELGGDGRSRNRN